MELIINEFLNMKFKGLETENDFLKMQFDSTFKILNDHVVTVSHYNREGKFFKTVSLGNIGNITFKANGPRTTETGIDLLTYDIIYGKLVVSNTIRVFSDGPNKYNINLGVMFLKAKKELKQILISMINKKLEKTEWVKTKISNDDHDSSSDED